MMAVDTYFKLRYFKRVVNGREDNGDMFEVRIKKKFKHNPNPVERELAIFLKKNKYWREQLFYHRGG